MIQHRPRPHTSCPARNRNPNAGSEGSRLGRQTRPGRLSAGHTRTRTHTHTHAHRGTETLAEAHGRAGAMGAEGTAPSVTRDRPLARVSPGAGTPGLSCTHHGVRGPGPWQSSPCVRLPSWPRSSRPPPASPPPAESRVGEPHSPSWGERKCSPQRPGVCGLGHRLGQHQGRRQMPAGL